LSPEPAFFRLIRVLIFSGVLFPGISACLQAQTTEGLLRGQVTDEKGMGLPLLWVVCTPAEGSEPLVTRTGDLGFYYFPRLPPGSYTVQTMQRPPLANEASAKTAADSHPEPVLAGIYQNRELHGIEVPVGDTVELNIRLTPLAEVAAGVSPANRNFAGRKGVFVSREYGPDFAGDRSTLIESNPGFASALDATLSDVIDPVQIAALPLTGRDVYTALLLQPGVTADPAATRGPGFSVNGQRPSSASFLLDGVEANNYLISGPLMTPTPEAIQEFRLSTSNFSAEYGGTSGYIANAVTRAGGTRWNGVLYAVGINDALNASGFQENAKGLAKPALKQMEPGFQAGGPVWRKRLFSSNSFEYLRLRSRLDPQSWLLPTAATLTSLPENEGGNLLTRYPAVAAPAGQAGTANILWLAPTSSLNQYLGLSRLDAQTADGRHHVLLRAALSQFDRPDYYWTPYPDFISGFRQNAWNVAASAIDNFRDSSLVNEARVSGESDLLSVGNNNHGLPSLGTCAGNQLCLPSSQSPFLYRNSGQTLQALDNLTRLRGRHLAKLGAGLLVRNLNGYVGNNPTGTYNFGVNPPYTTALQSFLHDDPYEYTITAARDNNSSAASTAASTLSDFNRAYRYFQFYGFAQDVWRLRDNLSISYGLRYEYSGAPVNVGRQSDDLIVPGPGSNLQTRLAGAFWAETRGHQALYASDPHDWAPRIGISWTPWLNVPILLRGSYGIFYDRPFDNLWQTVENNSFVPETAIITSPSIAYLTSPQSGPFYTSATLQPTMFQPGLRNPMVQSAFVGVQSRINHAVTLEMNSLASRGRGLLTTDFFNRSGDMAKLGLPPNAYVSYRANQGFSNYDAATLLVKFNLKYVQGQAAYTWSHSIDNQSDPLAGDYNLEFSSVSAGGSFFGRSTFVQQFNSGADIGNSDFDQRHSLVFFFIAPIPTPPGHGWAPALLRNWQVAGLASLRSGLPFTAYSDPAYSGSLINDRANLIDPAEVYVRQPIPGGMRILNPGAFCSPANGQIGNSGRNAFAGPGTIGANASVSRSFSLPAVRESARLVLRVDAYNALNHANLYVDAENPILPYESCGSLPQAGAASAFGTAQYGTTGVSTAFPVQVPLTATPRIVQFQLRFEF
jgi:hypothetical protein